MHRTSRGVAMIAALLFAFLLSACVNAPNRPGPTPLDMAKAYSTGVSTALVAAANAYTGPRAAEAKELAGKLQASAQAFAAMGDVSTARTAAISITTLIGQVWAIVGDRVGQQYALYVPMAIGVIQAFVLALPPPADAPAAPSAVTAVSGVRQ